MNNQIGLLNVSIFIVTLFQSILIDRFKMVVSMAYVSIVLKTHNQKFDLCKLIFKDATDEIRAVAISFVAVRWSKLKVIFCTCMCDWKWIDMKLCLQLNYVYEVEMTAGGSNNEYPAVKSYENIMYLSLNSNCKVIKNISCFVIYS